MADRLARGPDGLTAETAVATPASATALLSVDGSGAAPALPPFEVMLDNALIAILVHRDGKPLWVNETYVRMLGYASRAETMARHQVTSTVHPDDKAMVRARGKARLAGEDVPTHYEFRLIRKDGAVIWVDCLSSRITWDGEPALLTMQYDITARKRAEEGLQRSERLFASLFQGSPDVLIL